MHHFDARHSHPPAKPDVQDAHDILRKFVTKSGRDITYSGPEDASEKSQIASLALFKHVDALSEGRPPPDISVKWLAEAINVPRKRVHTLISRIDFLVRTGKSTYSVTCTRLTEEAWQLRPTTREPRTSRPRPLDAEKPPPRQAALSG